MKFNEFLDGIRKGLVSALWMGVFLSVHGLLQAQNTAAVRSGVLVHPTLSAEDVYGVSRPEISFEVHYPASIDPESLDDQDVWVVSPNGYSQLAGLIEVSNIIWDIGIKPPPIIMGLPADAPIGLVGYRAQYGILPSADQKEWNRGDNGRYTVLLEPEQVRYRSGNYLPPHYLGLFHVRMGEPKPMMPMETHIKISVSQEGGHQAKVTLVFPSSGYTVKDWGKVQVHGPTFEVHPTIVGPEPGSFNLPVLTEVGHVYDLGVLHPGPYRFAVFSEGALLNHQAFQVEPAGTHVPAEVDLKVETFDDGTAALLAVIHFIDPYHVLTDPGEPVLRERTYYINAKAQQVVFVRPPDEPAITEVKYRLTPPEKGEYRVVYQINGEPYAETRFSIGIPTEPKPVRHVEFIPIQEGERWFMEVQVDLAQDYHIVEWSELDRVENRFSAKLTLARYPVEVSDPGSGAIEPPAFPKPEEPIHRYDLGSLKPGAYLFQLLSDGDKLAAKEFRVKETTPPASIKAELISESIQEKGGTEHQFQVLYQSETPINVDSLGGGAIGVQSWVIAARFMGDIPLWAYQNAKLVDVQSEKERTRVRATYRIQSPDRGWQPDMNGWLLVNLNANTVKDSKGHHAPQSLLGEIQIEVPSLPAEATIEVEDSDALIFGDVRFVSFDYPYMSIIDWGKAREEGPTIYLDAKAHEVAFFTEPQEPLVEEHRYTLLDKRLKIARPYEYYQVVFRVNGEVVGRTQFKYKAGVVNPPVVKPDPIPFDSELIELNVEARQGSAHIRATIDLRNVGFTVTPVRFGEPVVKERVMSIHSVFEKVDLGDGPPTPGAPPVFDHAWEVDGLKPGKYAVILHINGLPAKEAYFVVEGNNAFHDWLKEVVTADQTVSKGLVPGQRVFDSDGDGVRDFVEWALDLDPLKADSHPGLKTGWVMKDGEKRLTVQFRKRKHADLVGYKLEVSSNLREWKSADDELEMKQSREVSEGVEEVTMELKPGSQPATFKFIRMILEDHTNTF